MIRMGFNKRKMEDTRRQEAEKEAARRAARPIGRTSAPDQLDESNP
jgi:hypothetical protein